MIESSQSLTAVPTRIRSYTGIEDIAPLTNLFNTIFDIMFPRTPNVWKWRFLESPYFDKECISIGLVQRYAGGAACGTIEPRLLANNSPISLLVINEVYTHPMFRGRGIATSCMKRIIEYGKSKGINYALLVSISKTGHGIYSKLGFRDISKLAIGIIPTGTDSFPLLACVFRASGRIIWALSFRKKDEITFADVKDYQKGMAALRAHFKPVVDEKWFRWVTNPPKPRMSWPLAVKRHGELVGVGRLEVKPLAIGRRNVGKIGMLVDVWTKDKRALSSLLSHAVKSSEEARTICLLYPCDILAWSFNPMIPHIVYGDIMVAEILGTFPSGIIHISPQDCFGEP
ncbi:MAG: GNAT family N-acetyltransferase [Candidatus Korarchaeota archaeon]